ncbi:hypothetical protein BGZ60DRAFT_532192 [Tricladium varicosporioides]|nr:hypothetical protein BGZ60DRAFT_532192 [Hymenoscyphus varicosporioides]
MAPTTLATAIAAIQTTTFQSITPLTTIWTPPASCFSQLLTNYYGGTCNSNGCTAYDATQLSSKVHDLWLSHGYTTTRGIQVSTQCAPPSTRIGDFWYSPAAGCPVGYTTATSWASNYALLERTVICCPSLYPTPTTVTDDGYACWRYMNTADEIVIVVADGVLYERDPSGYVTATYVTVSTISTTTMQPARFTVTPTVFAPGIQMVVTIPTPKSTTTIYPESISATGTGHSDSSGTGPEGFHVGKLNRTHSIVVVVITAVFGWLLLCCCCGCLSEDYEHPTPDINRSTRIPPAAFEPTVPHVSPIIRAPYADPSGGFAALDITQPHSCVKEPEVTSFVNQPSMVCSDPGQPHLQN